MDGMTPIPFVDGTRFSPAELSALRLDGETMTRGDFVFPVGPGPTFVERCRALSSVIDPRAIAERRTVLWLCGCLEQPPVPLEVCVDTRQRVPAPQEARSTLRQVVIDVDDIDVHHGVRMTSPARTMADLLRQPRAPDFECLRRFVAVTGLSASDVEAVINRRGHLAHKRVAEARIERLFRSVGRDPIDVIDRVDAAHGVEQAVEVGGVAHLEHEAAEGQALVRR
jgi:hypothetical protein